MSQSSFEARAVRKSYAGQAVLNGVSLSIAAGTIHALVGENGAGKSTLASIIAGANRPDSGSIHIDGKQVDISSPRSARQHGITFVSQELSLVPKRSVIENVFAGILPTAFPGIVSRPRMLRQFKELLGRTNLQLPADTLVEELNSVEQEFVEILRAVAGGARLIILDEPTTATTQDQADQIYQLMRDLAAAGVAVVLISHDLDDLLRVVDTVSVLRDGNLVKTVAAKDVTKDALITLMIGRKLSELFPKKVLCDNSIAPALEARGLSRTGILNDISLSVRPGEILGIAGLVGSGRTELLRAIVGADKVDSGILELHGKRIDIKSLQAAQRAGIALIPENRKTQGLHLDHSISRNIVLPHLPSLSRWGFVNRSQVRQAALRSTLATRVKMTSAGAAVRTLSGGNQQRVLFAKWLVDRPDVLLVDEPTRGVDVKGKRIIYEILVEVARQGTAVIVVSSEATEVIGLSHRIIVMHKGSTSRELVGDEISEDAIVRAAFGGVEDGKATIK
jgi:rhamnose transport system ATP-binding protein